MQFGLPAFAIGVIDLLRIPTGGLPDELSFSNVSIEVYVLVAIIWPLCFNFFSVYDGKRNETLLQEMRNVFLAGCGAAFFLAGVLFLTYRETSRGVFLLFFIFDIVFLLAARGGLFAYRLRTVDGEKASRRAALIVGAGKVGQDVAAQLKKYAWSNVAVIGYLDDDPLCVGKSFDGLPVLGTLDQATQVQSKFLVQDVIV
ncbi:MAG: hypothetical protein L0Y55_19930, partial [Anaerolineales bacterium]|nr:hypothetical protein [Anaerolineales bacterium]